MDEAQFIEDSVRLQLGGILDRALALTEESRARALAGSSGSTLAWNSSEGVPYPANGWRLKQGAKPFDADALENAQKFINGAKAQGALRGLLAAGAKSDLIIDMQDRRLRKIAMEDGNLHPVFTFNREVGDTSRILWPLPKYHDLGTPGFLGPSDWDDVPWPDKQNKIGWRGNLNGRADWHGEVRREGQRLKPLYKRYAKGDITEEQARYNLAQFPRHRLMMRHIDDPRFDIGFTGADGMKLEQFPFMAPFMRSRVSQQAFRHYKYLLVLKGMDVGSSFYWTMNSGSLGLVMDGAFETFASGHFRPWEHYVPFKADLSDLEERIAWCNDNDAACREMAERAGEVCDLIGQAELRTEIGRQIIQRLEDRIVG